MKNSSLLLLVAGALQIATGAPALSASFDCAKAAKEDEITICNTPALSQLDTEMGALWFTYSRIPFAMGASGARVDDAEAFLASRAKCGAETECLLAAYKGRVAALKNAITDWLHAQAAETNGAGWSVKTLPFPVLTVAEGYAAQCRQLGGRLDGGLDALEIMTGDIDGDGYQDFVLNPQDMQCSAAATAFCGNGGCNISLALSGDGYRTVDILGGAPALRVEGEGTVLEIWMHRANCDSNDLQSDCIGQYSWENGKLETRYQLRPHSATDAEARP